MQNFRDAVMSIDEHRSDPLDVINYVMGGGRRDVSEVVDDGGLVDGMTLADWIKSLGVNWDVAMSMLPDWFRKLLPAESAGETIGEGLWTGEPIDWSRVAGDYQAAMRGLAENIVGSFVGGFAPAVGSFF